MKLSEDRLTHLSHKVWDALYDDDLVDYPDDEKALLAIKATVLSYFRVEDQIDDEVRHKIQSQKRGIPEGSREWDVLYEKYHREEAQKRGR